MDIQPDQTVDQVAHQLSVSRPTVYKLIHKGYLHAYHAGRATRITRESLEHFRKTGGAK